jgi:acyl-coenzyme A synthetase/AMP-(fatty) acid ligase
LYILKVQIVIQQFHLGSSFSGWMMWNWMVTALALGTTLVLYDGSPLHPHPGALWDLVSN